MQPNQFKEIAQIHIDTTRQAFNVELGFDERSILELDGLIQQAWPDQLPVETENVILLFGSFLGEAIIATLGGQWVENEQGWGIKIGDGTLMVFTKVKKRLLNGMEDSLSYYYQSMKKMAADNFQNIAG